MGHVKAFFSLQISCAIISCNDRGFLVQSGITNNLSSFFSSPSNINFSLLFIAHKRPPCTASTTPTWAAQRHPHPTYLISHFLCPLKASLSPSLFVTHFSRAHAKRRRKKYTTIIFQSPSLCLSYPYLIFNSFHTRVYIVDIRLPRLLVNDVIFCDSYVLWWGNAYI